MMDKAVIFLLYGLLSYALGYALRSTKILKLKQYILDYSITLALAILLLGIIAIEDASLKQAAFTFSSVYLGFWLSGEQKRRDEKRALKYYLGLIWDEFRFNSHQYKVIESNFKFLFDTPERIILNAVKMGAVYALSGQLKVEAHKAYLSSGAVTTLTQLPLPIKEKDKLFNEVEIAYSNLEHLKSFLFNVSMDFKNKADMAEIILDSPFKDGAINDMEAKVQAAARQLMIAKRTCIKAQKLVNDYLDKLGVKADTAELRESVLTKKDKSFIDKIIRKTPIDPNEVFHNQNS